MSLKFIYPLFFSVLFSGCASTITHTSSWSDMSKEFEQNLENTSYAYSGYCFNLKMIVRNNTFDTHEETVALIAFYDMPLSFALDTVLLPIDLGYDLYRHLKTKTSTKTLCSKL